MIKIWISVPLWRFASHRNGNIAQDMLMSPCKWAPSHPTPPMHFSRDFLSFFLCQGIQLRPDLLRFQEREREREKCFLLVADFSFIPGCARIGIDGDRPRPPRQSERYANERMQMNEALLAREFSPAAAQWRIFHPTHTHRHTHTYI